MKKEFYLEKIGTRGNIDIWIVDGQKIRTDVEKEFTNFGQHFHFDCIPENEFWLDKEAQPNERRFFIDHLLIEWQLQKEGKSYADAITEADKKEKAERLKTGDLEEVKNSAGKLDPKKVHKHLLKKINYEGEELSVWVVDGRLIRSSFYIDFTEGGHDFVYKFVPKHEIWLDDDLMEKERPYVLLHELNERQLMSQGWTYDKAHANSSKIEWESRHNPAILEEKLGLLGWQS
jgi:hypothetical protein